MAEEQNKPRRMLGDVSQDELREAVAAMCRALGVPGSVAGRYDLYGVVAREWRQAQAGNETSSTKA